MTLPISVLLIDDEEDLLELVSEGLQDFGFQVTTATSAAMALDLVRKSVPDVIVSDVRMPRMNGMELLKKLTSEGLRPSAFLFVTAFEEYSAAEFEQLGASGLLQKPIRTAVLKDEIEKVLERNAKNRPISS